MKIIIKFPDDIKPKYYNQIKDIINLDAKAPKPIRIGEQRYMIYLTGKTNINVTLVPKTSDEIQLELEKQNREWRAIAGS